MSTSTLHEWVHANPDRARTYAQEALIVDVAEEIWATLDKVGMSKAQLAEKLGRSKAFVTQVLNGTRNMTLRTLADISFALGVNVCMRLTRSKQADASWESPLNVNMQQRRPLFALDIEGSNDSNYHTVTIVPLAKAA
ncbi:MAG: helix-turn-helix transcriptional regulator [Steroidobacteraceae bacterium]